jgi:DNA-binding XRE family transcriptional regulator
MLRNLAAARAAAGMNQTAAAALISKTQATYSKIERGDVSLSAADALIFCRAFSLDLEALLIVA